MLVVLVERMATCGRRIALLFARKGRAAWRVRSAESQDSRGPLRLLNVVYTMPDHASGTMAVPRG
jgi:hypothetical protein